MKQKRLLDTTNEVKTRMNSQLSYDHICQKEVAQYMTTHKFNRTEIKTNLTHKKNNDKSKVLDPFKKT